MLYRKNQEILKVFQASTPYKNDNFNKYFYLKNKKYFEIENYTSTYCQEVYEQNYIENLEKLFFINKLSRI